LSLNVPFEHINNGSCAEFLMKVGRTVVVTQLLTLDRRFD